MHSTDTTDDAALFAACVGAPAVVVAMPEEAEPFLQLASRRCEHPQLVGNASFHALELAGRAVLLVRTGIGLVNAASALTAAVERFEPGVVVSAGSCGGLRADVNVGDLVVGTEFRYADADATAFGYAPGQVPGMPEAYPASADLVTAASRLVAGGNGTVWRGTMLSGGSFVTAENVGGARGTFPEALSTDMESTALAQVCQAHGRKFLAVRSISDLCGPAADQQFHLELDLVARLSADAVVELLSTLPAPAHQG
ncbi:5'-methylthioadenosine/S-adenosylhomocysteine nucleosidase [Kocuria tytonicola]|uniref:adenosylhomocysteine nucleosidase n=1 Tax=Kocuria tytonicola TaxID=2055946 RepID=A0A3L9L2H3_9MICC|nr:5'-methylthioadenosine/S-adenosylhomocysteine nucleosidase [Kocuria tytonicola]RLY92378.1 5'-methylthioadenosine/S-adenosylhomocysteine nucleosidase [Kocuria tytonicola]RLZ04192.1 5'-methylthioadenosine/S-adenosylhomocysteine nucleosidase [Kocuria tytonicola]